MRVVALTLAIAVTSCTSATPPTEPTATSVAVSSHSPFSGWPGDAVYPAEPTPAVRLVTQPAPPTDPPAVTVAAAPFPTVASLALRARPATAQDEVSIRSGIDLYLEALDRYRESGQGKPLPEGCAGLGCPPTGRFAAAVVAGLNASATPGVKRKFVVERIRIDRVLAKPWGTRAVAEVTATIRDRAVARDGQDQVEIGRLRLVGDRPAVVDGWDAAAAGWFNGPRPLEPQIVRLGVATAVGFLLRNESWRPGSPRDTTFGAGGETPYQKARFAYLTQLDRTGNAARFFLDVAAVIERYDTFAEIPDGLATVRIRGTVVTTDAGGIEHRVAVSRRVVVLFGNWMPEIVDEEIVPGTWLSGGDLALGERDHNFA